MTRMTAPGLGWRIWRLTFSNHPWDMTGPSVLATEGLLIRLKAVGIFLVDVVIDYISFLLLPGQMTPTYWLKQHLFSILQF